MKSNLLNCILGILTVGTMIVAPQQAYSGPSTGGGGFAVLCPATAVSPATVQLLDLYEGENEFGLKLRPSTGNLSEDYFLGVKRTYMLQGNPNLAESRREASLKNLRIFLQSSKFVESQSDLPPAYDLGEKPWIPSQCQIAQIAYYDDSSSTIFILRSAWDKMSTLEQAALVHHELWYREHRRGGAVTSENARASVAQIFSKNRFLDLKDQLPADAQTYSVADQITSSSPLGSRMTVFYGVNSPSAGVTRLQFTHVNGIGQLSKTYADFPLMSWGFHLGRAKQDPNKVECILDTPQLDKTVTAELVGLATQKMSITLSVKTGEPIAFVLKNAGQTVSREFVGTGTNCKALN